jgi:thioredoxin-like negative regulator of GroEL
MRLRARVLAGAMLSLCLAAAGPVSVVAEDTDSPDAALSRIHARYALEALEDGRRDEAVRLATTALEYSEENADAHHLLARALSPRQAATGRVVSHLEAALSTGGFRLTDERQARLLLAETYLRTDRSTQALSFLEEVGAAGSADADLRILAARALHEAGRLEEAETVARAGRDLFPDDARFMLFLLELDPIPGPRWGRLLDENVSSRPAYLSALLYYAERVRNTERRAELAQRHLNLGGENPDAAVLLAEVAASRNDPQALEAAWERFVRMDGLSDKAAVERMYSVIPEGTLHDRVSRVLARLDRTLVRDEDENGYWEERFVFSDGTLTRWLVDSDENGVVEYDIELEARVPRAAARTPEGFSLRWGAYPEVATAELPAAELTAAELPVADSAVLRYAIVPGELTYDLLSEDLNWGAAVPGPAFPFALEDAPPILGEELLLLHAYRREVVGSGGAVLRVDTLDDGAVLRRVYDEDRDGEIDRVVSFENGVPTSGMRDADRDGRFEIGVQYTDGEPALLLVDADGDGVAEYRERLKPERSYAWDYNADGVIDAQELVLGRNEVLRQFSTDDDGAFELSVSAYRESVADE